MSHKIRVAIIDDHTLFREGVAAVLKADPDIEIVGQGASAVEAIRLASGLKPDIILLDIDMPGGGLNAIRTIATACPTTKIVMLTVSVDEENVIAALKAGARAYVLKGVASAELIGILRTVCAGESYVTPTLAANVLSELTSVQLRAPLPTVALKELTKRERQILELIATGLSNKEIGHQLGLTERTVKHYVTDVLQKLNVRNRVEAAVLARSGQPSLPEGDDEQK